jgi:hypothetical protein
MVNAIAVGSLKSTQIPKHKQMVIIRPNFDVNKQNEDLKIALILQRTFNIILILNSHLFIIRNPGISF